MTFGESARLHHAAARAFDTVSPEKSITHYARAMELIGQVTDSSDDRTKREFAAIAANLAQARIRVGEIDAARMLLIDTAAPIFERFGDVRGLAVTKGQIADILQARGDLDEALRIRREEEIPVYERLGDVHSLAVTKGQIADILQARGELDEALRIRREEQIPVYERLGDVRELAVTKGKIADILQARGDLDEALRIRREEQIPVYERLGDVRALAVTKGKIADILQARGDLDEALRIRRDEQIPVFERLGDLRELAIAKAMCAQVLVAQDEGDQIVPAMREFAEAVMLLAQCQAYPELAKVAIDAAQIAAKGGHHREVQRASAAGAWASLLLNESSQAGQFLAYFSMASIHRGAPFPKILLDAAVAAVGLTENDDVKKQLAPIVGAAAQAVGIADEDFPKWLEEHNKRLDTEGFINMVAPGLLDAINQPPAGGRGADRP
ncbi:MAG: hypothetical protein M5R36_24170 [Deltaproteobacteria bacterium]|nr:hypothetical protein [Deltaproteobacteria bacterium]